MAEMKQTKNLKRISNKFQQQPKKKWKEKKMADADENGPKKRKEKSLNEIIIIV